MKKLTFKMCVEAIQRMASTMGVPIIFHDDEREVGEQGLFFPFSYRHPVVGPIKVKAYFNENGEVDAEDLSAEALESLCENLLAFRAGYPELTVENLLKVLSANEDIHLGLGDVRIDWMASGRYTGRRCASSRVEVEGSLSFVLRWALSTGTIKEEAPKETPKPIEKPKIDYTVPGTLDSHQVWAQRWVTRDSWSCGPSSEGFSLHLTEDDAKAYIEKTHKMMVDENEKHYGHRNAPESYTSADGAPTPIQVNHKTFEKLQKIGVLRSYAKLTDMVLVIPSVESQ